MSHTRKLAFFALFILFVIGGAFRRMSAFNAQSSPVRQQPLVEALSPSPANLSALTAAPFSSASTFSNTAAITINDNANASPYPSAITVSGITANTVTKVEVTLNAFTHTYPDDVDVILVGPNGQRAVLMSDAGSNNSVTTQTLTFSQTASTSLPDSTALTTGTYRPVNYASEGGALTDNFPAPGPSSGELCERGRSFNG